MRSASLETKINSFKNQRVLVVGDVMLDHYTYGKVDRISPEAPVPIIHIVKESFIPGGAGNVFLNLCQFGASVHLVSVVGSDVAASKLKDSFEDFSDCGELSFFVDAKRRTTIKQRVVAGQQQLLRVDTEDTFAISDEVTREIISFVTSRISEFDCICISDYAKGVMTKELAIELIALAQMQSIPVLVDTKPKNFQFYSGCSLLTPNTAEVMAGYPNMTYVAAAQQLSQDTGAPVLITRGAEGVSYITAKDGEVFTLPSYAKAGEVLDVSGAGDTVVAALTLSMSSGMEPKDAAYVASKAAAVAVTKPHTSPVHLAEVLSIL